MCITIDYMDIAYVCELKNKIKITMRKMDKYCNNKEKIINNRNLVDAGYNEGKIQFFLGLIYVKKAIFKH